MKEYNFKKNKLTEDEKIWFSELLKHNFEKIESRSLKVNLMNKISSGFDPTKIDQRLINNNRLTLLGLWYLDAENHLIKKTDLIIQIIKNFIRDNPILDSIDSQIVASSLNIPERDVNIVFTLLFNLNYCNGGNNSQEGLFLKISFGPEPTAFDKILNYKNIDETLENFYNEYDPNKSNFTINSILPSKLKENYFNQQVDKNKLKKLLSRLNGIRETVVRDSYVRKEVGDDYNLTVKQIEKIIKEDLTEFLLAENFWHYNTYQEKWCDSDKIINKLFQLIPYLEEEITDVKDSSEIDILYNSIIDEELKSRCTDILEANSHYDRVINQSTQILEDRIRRKANAERSLIGTQLVNKVLNTNISRSILKLSDNPDEHEGISHICRGIMLAFRNPSHHHLTEKYTQSEALKFCSFIDNILQIIDNAEINSQKD